MVCPSVSACVLFCLHPMCQLDSKTLFVPNNPALDITLGALEMTTADEEEQKLSNYDFHATQIAILVVWNNEGE